MSRELIRKYPEILNYSSVWMDTITHNTRQGSKEFGLSNTNRLIRTYEGCVGLKTGSTSKAKFCVSAVAKRKGITLIAVVMAAPDSRTRVKDASMLFDYGFAKCIFIQTKIREASRSESDKRHKRKNNSDFWKNLPLSEYRRNNF